MAMDEKKKKRKFKRRFIVKPTLVIGILMAMILVSGNILSAAINLRTNTGDIELLEFYECVDAGEVESVRIVLNSDTFDCRLKSGETYKVVNPRTNDFVYDLQMRGIHIDITQSDLVTATLTLILGVPAAILIIILSCYIGNMISSLNVSNYKVESIKSNTTRFSDIAGISEIKDEILSITNLMTQSSRLKELGARTCKGILMYGPPGVGKTLLAKAIAGEVGVPFISACGSDFEEMFVGLGAARIRNLWTVAEANAPCVLFIDEIDALGNRKNIHSVTNQTLNAVLQKMDGLKENNGVLVIAATNNKDLLDDALLRPGRFDRQLYVGAPRLKEDREEIVKLYMDKKKLAEDVTLEKVSELTVGLTGAQIEQVFNQAVYSSIDRGKDGTVYLKDIDSGVMRLHTNGVPVKKSSEHDRKIVSVHEAGHCLERLISGRKVIRVSVIPYSSGIGGLTMANNSDTEDMKLKMQSDFVDDIKELLAGMVAEEIVFGEHSNGASNDIERASQIIHNIQSSYAFDSDSIINTLHLEGMGVSIDNTAKIKKCNEELLKYRDEVREDLTKHKDELLKLSDGLMENDTIVYPTLENLLGDQ